MYVLVVSYKNGHNGYFGPFPSRMRAEYYASACVRDCDLYARHCVKTLTTPYNVVKSVEWRD